MENSQEQLVYGAHRDGCRRGCVQIDRNFDLQEVRLVIAVKMEATTFEVSESPLEKVNKVEVLKQKRQELR